MLALAFSRPYWHETIGSLQTSTRTHVQTAGDVTLVRCEADGDWHIRLSDAKGRFIVAEIIPALPMTPGVKPGTPCQKQTEPPTRVGRGLVVKGIRRRDSAGGHGWPEVHPVEQLIDMPGTEIGR